MSRLLPYYRTEERQRALLAEARSWLLTPFRENCAVRGRDGGVDCVHFLAACHAAAGACGPLDLPTLPVERVKSWHVHNPDSLIMEWLSQPAVRGRVRRLDDGEPRMIGDMPLLRIEQTEHHIALWGWPDLFHVAIPAGVVSHSCRDRELLPLIRCTYRIFEEAGAS